MDRSIWKAAGRYRERAWRLSYESRPVGAGDFGMLVNVDGQGLRNRTESSGIVGQHDVVLTNRPRGGSSVDASGARTIEAKTVKRAGGRKREAGWQGTDQADRAHVGRGLERAMRSDGERGYSAAEESRRVRHVYRKFGEPDERPRPESDGGQIR